MTHPNAAFELLAPIIPLLLVVLKPRARDSVMVADAAAALGFIVP